MSTWGEALRQLLLTPGATYACAADARTGEIVSEVGRDSIDPGVVMDWGMVIRTVLDDVGSDDLDDLMITSRRSYRLLRVLGSGSRRPILVHLCLDRGRSNLAVARRELAVMRVGDPVMALSIPEQASSPAVEAAEDGTDGRPRPAAADPAPGASVALPRRTAARRRPAPVSAPDEAAGGLTPVLAQQWATDTDTLSRLLGALRALS